MSLSAVVAVIGDPLRGIGEAGEMIRVGDERRGRRGAWRIGRGAAAQNLAHVAFVERDKTFVDRKLN